MRSREQNVLLSHVLLLDLVDVHQNHGLAPADEDDSLLLALGALQPERNLLGRFGLLSEYGFGLSSIT